jgi:hypothetical protein
MRRGLVLLLAVAGILVAASIGYAAYLASRDSVGLPVTKLETTPRNLAPTTKTRTATRRTATTIRATTTATTVDDHGGRRGRDNSGSGSGGHGSDD